MLTSARQSRDTLCNGMSRRDMLRVGALGVGGLALPNLLSARAASVSHGSVHGMGFGKAKSCILLVMTGGYSHLDTIDMKPDAPEGIRGEFKPIPTNVPGIQVSEHMPKMAGLADKYAIMRSVYHTTTDHTSSAYMMLTGEPDRVKRFPADNPIELPTDPPSIGSVIARQLPGDPNMHPYVYIGHGYFTVPGRSAGYLGKTFDPFTVSDDPNKPDFAVNGLSLPQDIPSNRLDNRRALLRAVDERTELVSQSQPAALGTHYRKAFDLLSSGRAQRAFDLSLEPPTARDRYGRNTFGQSLLLSRRLVESGVSLVTVTWGNWDTHNNNFNLLRDPLLPTADQALSALLEDLSLRGMLDDTMVVWTGDFGRTPKINNLEGGRDHWPQCFSVLMAGGGIEGGQIYGSSDGRAAYPRDKPTSTPDLIATIYHRLGIPWETELPDLMGRPMKLCFGKPVMDMPG